MAIMDMAMVGKDKLGYLSVLGLLVSNFSLAADSNIAPYISIEEIFSNNVGLVNIDPEDSFVTQGNVGINSSFDTTIIEGNFDAAYSHLFYSHDSSLDKGYESLDADLKITPWRKGPALTLTGGVANVPRSLGENSYSDLISGDTVRTTNYGAGLSYQVTNSDFNLSISGQYDDRRAEDGIGESYGSGGSLTFSNGSGHRVIFWDTSGSYSDRKNQGRNAESYQIEAKLGLITGWKFNPFIRYFDEDYKGLTGNQTLSQGASLGIGLRWEPVSQMNIDLSYNQVEDDERGDDYAAASFNWQPTTRTSIFASYNQRFYGDSYGLNISHRNKRLTNSISYNETVQAFQRDFFETFIIDTLFCPIDQPLVAENCLASLDNVSDPDQYTELALLGVRPIEDDQFSLFKTLSWNTSLALPRTTLSMTISGNQREDLNTGDTQEFNSINLSAKRRVNQRSDINISWQFTRNEYFTLQDDIGDQRNDYYRSYNLGYSRQLGETLSLDFNLRHLVRDSNRDGRSYDETRATLSVKKDF
ncbi:TIGR03016 family PEP-CTERM system-associated outer membrane protein [Colwellia sp. MEBiC06753]